MDAKYKILFNGEFKSWVVREEFIASFCEALGVSKEKAAALFDLERKVVLKKNLSDEEARRYIKAFDKLGMYVSKRLIMKPFVGPMIPPESQVFADIQPDEPEEIEQEEMPEDNYPQLLEQGRKGLSSLSQNIRSLIRREHG